MVLALGVLFTLLTFLAGASLEVLCFPTFAGVDVFLVAIFFRVCGGWSTLADLAFLAVVVTFTLVRAVSLPALD